MLRPLALSVAPPRCCLWAQLAALLTHPEQSSMALSKLQLTLGGLTVGAAAGYCLLAARQAAIPAAARRSRGVSAAASSPGPGVTQDAALGSLWAGVVEVMLSEQALGEDIYLVPGDSRPERSSSAGGSVRPLPAVLRESVVFAMTAFDPVSPPETRTLEANTAANGRLWQEIKKLSPGPTRVWPTWGYNFDEGKFSFLMHS
jgi:hypothetical protein